MSEPPSTEEPPPDSPVLRRRTARVIVGVLGAATATTIGLTIGLSLRSGPDPAAPSAVASAAPSSQSRIAPPGAVPEPLASVSAEPDVRAAVQALLDRRAAALMARDADGFLAGIDAVSGDFAQRQGELFEAVADVPLESWGYAVVDEVPVPASALTEPTGEQRRAVRVVHRHRIAGYDEADVTAEQLLTVVRRDGSWLLADDVGGGPNVRPSGLWDFGRVRVVEGERSLVLGLGEPSELERYAREADAAVPAVTELWGPDWPQRVVVVVPESSEQLAMLLGGRVEDYESIAAVTTGQVSDETRTRQSDRILLNPDASAQLSDVGRQVVLAHEVTHVATRQVTDGSVPAWLSEGFADYVGYRDTDVPVHVAARDTMAAIEQGDIPLALPADSDFTGRTGDLSAAYEHAWLAARLIVELAGEDGLEQVYRAAGASAGDSAAGAEEALRTVLGLSTAEFTVVWRDDLQQQAAQE